MKFIQTVIVAVALVVPTVSSFAQSTVPVTRAQVRADLVQLEKAGYSPGSGDQTTYPAEVQAAEARVATQNSAANSFGGFANGSSSSGSSRNLIPGFTNSPDYQRP